MRLAPRFLLLACLALLAACAGRRAPEQVPGECTRTLLEPHPLWTAGAAWRPGDDQLVLVDPNGELLDFTAGGTFRRRVETPEISALDYSTPVRLQAAGDGYLFGDKDQLLWLDRELRPGRRLEPFAASSHVAEGRLSDFAPAGGKLYAYADFSADGEDWRRGFVRIDLRGSGIQVIEELPIEAMEEWSAYYFYDLRPYVATAGRRAYVLRLAEPPAVFRATRKELEPLFSEPLAAGFEARSLYAHGDALYLLTSRELAPEAEPGLVQPELLQTPDRVARLQSAQLAGKIRHQWRLIKIHPESGRRLATFLLPTDSPGLTLLPGEPAWGLIESPTTPNTGGASKTHFLRLPAGRLAATDGGTHALACGGLEGTRARP